MHIGKSNLHVNEKNTLLDNFALAMPGKSFIMFYREI